MDTATLVEKFEMELQNFSDDFDRDGRGWIIDLVRGLVSELAVRDGALTAIQGQLQDTARHMPLPGAENAALWSSLKKTQYMLDEALHRLYDRAYTLGFRAGWNAGLQEDTDQLEIVTNRQRFRTQEDK